MGANPLSNRCRNLRSDRKADTPLESGAASVDLNGFAGGCRSPLVTGDYTSAHRCIRAMQVREKQFGAKSLAQSTRAHKPEATNRSQTTAIPPFDGFLAPIPRNERRGKVVAVLSRTCRRSSDKEFLPILQGDCQSLLDWTTAITRGGKARADSARTEVDLRAIGTGCRGVPQPREFVWKASLPRDPSASSDWSNNQPDHSHNF